MIKYFVVIVAIYLGYCCVNFNITGRDGCLQLVLPSSSENVPSSRAQNLEEYEEMLKTQDSVILHFTGLVNQYGYTAKEYTVTTEDGYILKLHRVQTTKNIRKIKKKPVVYLQHGAGASSDFFILFGGGQSLVFQLIDAGYDVWCGNIRGNTYAQLHQRLDRKDPEFWNFSLDEIAAYDLSKSIDFVLNETHQKSLAFIGYSMGTTLSYMLLSAKPQYNEKIHLLVSIGPGVYFLPDTSMLLNSVGTIAMIYHSFAMKVLRMKSTKEILPQSSSLEKLGRITCSGNGFNACKIVLKMIADVDSMDSNIIPKILGYIPAGISYDTVKHYTQLLHSNVKFQKFDYDNCRWFDYTCPTHQITNKEKYNQDTPPEYNLTLVTTPNLIIYSMYDTVTYPKDVEYLISKLSNDVIIKKVPDEAKFNHLDFFSHKDARKLFYNHMLEVMSTYAELN